MNPDSSLERSLEAWLAGAGYAIDTVQALPGDVSPRRYFRLRGSGGTGGADSIGEAGEAPPAAAGRSTLTAIAAAYPSEMVGTCLRFARTTELLQGVGVRTPRILAMEAEGRFMLLEDLGSKTLFEEALPWPRRWPFYRQAVRVIEAIQGLQPAVVAGLNPTLDGAVLARELEQTWEVFLLPGKFFQDEGLRRDLEAFFHQLCRDLGAEPAVPCHRDFMVRNLVAMGEGGVAVLDHQDLRLGPPAYDLASLLNDSLFAPPEVERAFLEGMDPGEESYRRAAVQRTFKAVGTFAAFARRGSDRRLPLIPPTLERGLTQMARLPEGEDLAPRLREALASTLPTS